MRAVDDVFPRELEAHAELLACPVKLEEPL
jgi:hypothetical protein